MEQSTVGIPDLGALKWAIEYGALFVLSLVMFFFYRQDRIDFRRERDQENAALRDLVQSNIAAMTAVKTSIDQNNRIVETLSGHCVAVQLVRANIAMQGERGHDSERDNPSRRGQ